MSITATTRNMARVDAAVWATHSNRIRLQDGYYRFGDRVYLREPMSLDVRRKCFIKGTQGGASVSVILYSLHGQIMGRYPLGVLYLFPTTDDVHEFSKSNFGPLIASNPLSIGKFVKNVKGSTDTTSLKQINGSNLFLRGAGLTKKIEHLGESSKLKGFSVDRVVFDEVELMDKEAMSKARGRMGNSRVKEEVYIGNPGIPGRGIDEIFMGSDDVQGSDQRYWMRKCLSCGEYTCAELEFPNCVKMFTKWEKGNKGYIACKKCGRQVFVRNGVWVPQRKEQSEYMHGYMWSQLTSPNNDPASILADFNNPPEGNLGDVMRLRLGKAYIAAEDQLTTSDVFRCCGKGAQLNSHPGPCAFGLDVGKTKHLIIGARTGRETYEIFRVERLSSWDDIGDMVRRFNCKSGVIDIRPYEDEARRFQNAMNMRIFLCAYSETTVIGKSYNPRTKIVTVNRTEICDATHNLVADRGKLTIPRQCPEIVQFAKEVCNPAKILEIHKRTKQAIYRYRGTEDHYRHALNYFLLAASGNQVGIVTRTGRKQRFTHVKNDYARM